MTHEQKLEWLKWLEDLPRYELHSHCYSGIDSRSIYLKVYDPDGVTVRSTYNANSLDDLFNTLHRHIHEGDNTPVASELAMLSNTMPPKRRRGRPRKL